MLEQLKKMVKKECFFVRKKHFHLFKNLSSQKWEGGNMRAGAGRLVIFSLAMVKICRLLIVDSTIS